MRKIIYIFFLILILNCNKTYATNENIIENQSKELNIDNFIEETENITNTNILNILSIIFLRFIVFISHSIYSCVCV